jgi:hypothetical protein
MPPPPSAAECGASRNPPRFFVKASPRRLSLSPGPRLGGEEVHKTVDLVVMLAEAARSDGGTSGAFSVECPCTVGHNGSGGAGGDVLIACTSPPDVLEVPSRVSVPPRQAKRFYKLWFSDNESAAGPGYLTNN